MVTPTAEGLGEADTLTNNAFITDDMVDEENRLSQETERQDSKTCVTKDRSEKEDDQESKNQCYKRLVHLLNCSKFYTEFILQRLNHTKESHTKKKGGQVSSEFSTKEGSEDIPTSSQLSKISVKNELVEVDNLKSRTLREKNTNTNEDAQSNEDPQSPVRKVIAKRKRADDKHDISTFIDHQTIRDIEKRIKLEEKPAVTAKGNSNLITEEETRETAFGHIVSTRQPLLFEGGVLRDYQLEGLEWLKCLYENGMSGILADEMGLGKTLQTIALICHLIEKRCGGPFLVIAPLSTLPNWMIEFERFAPQIPVMLYHGSSEKRRELQSKMTQTRSVNDVKVYPVILTSFEIPLRDIRVLRPRNWKYIIVDEGHRLKNYKSQLSCELRLYRASNKLLLTGTPLQNNLTELWALLNFILPEFFHDLELFETFFDVSDLQDEQGNNKIIEQEHQSKILSTMHQILMPFLLRRLKVDVDLNIPSKKELLVYAPMTPIQLEMYRATVDRSIISLLGAGKNTEVKTSADGKPVKRKCTLKKKSYLDYESDEELDSPSSSEDEGIEIVDAEDQDYKVRLKMTNVSMMLRKIVNHPYLVQMPIVTGKKGKEIKVDEELVNKSGKLLVLDAMLAKLKPRGHKVLIFSTFYTVLDLIEEYLVMRNMYRYCRIDGTTRIDERREAIRAFNTDPDIFAFLLSTRAGGLGINLTGADTVIIYDSDWNPQVDLQAQDRCHRIGQTKPVVVYRFVTSGTIDEKIVGRGAAKRKLEKMIILKGKFKLNKSGEKDLMTLQELKELLESHDHQKVIHSNGYVFSNEELEELLDRSDLMDSELKEKEKCSSDTKKVFKVL